MESKVTKTNTKSATIENEFEQTDNSQFGIMANISKSQFHCECDNEIVCKDLEPIR